MKKLLFFFLLTFSTWLLPAQDYIPLVQEQATWIIHAYGEWGQDLHGYRIEGISLFTLSGQLLREWRGNGSGLQEIDAGHLPVGVYMLRVRSSEKAGWGRLVIAR